MPAKKEEKRISLTITMEEKLKNDFSEICEELGMSLSGAITVFAKQVVRDRKLPFVPSANKQDSTQMKGNNKKEIDLEDLEKFMAYMEVVKHQ